MLRVGRLGRLPSHGGGGGGAWTAQITWDPAQHGPEITLSPDALTASNFGSSGLNQNVRATRSQSTGLRYAEFTTLTASVGESTGFGIATGTFNITGTGVNDWIGGDPGNLSIAVYDSGNIRLAGAVASSGAVFHSVGDLVGMAVNLTTKLLWFRVNGGVWGPSGDPAAGTGGQSWGVLPTTTVFPASYVFESNSMRVNFGGAPYAFTPPAGALNW